MTIRKLEVLAMTQDLEGALAELKGEIEEMMQDREEWKVDQERLLELETIARDQRARIQDLETQVLVMAAVKQGFLERNQELEAENQRIKEANKAVQDQNKALQEEVLRLEKHCRRQLAGIQVVRAREDSQEERLQVAMALIKEQREMLEVLLGLGTEEIPQS